MSRANRSNGEGSVYYSERDGRWEAKISVGRDADGKLIRRKFTGKTRREVTDLRDAQFAVERVGFELFSPEPELLLVLPRGRGQVPLLEARLVDAVSWSSRSAVKGGDRATVPNPR